MNPRLLALPLIVGAAALALVGAGALSPTTEDTTTQAQAAIAKTAEAFVGAFEKRDAKALAEFWTVDGDYIDLSGRTIKGREAIAADFAQVFAESKELKLRIEIGALQFPAPDVAVEDGVTTVFAPDAPLPSRVRYTNILVKRDGKWLLSSVREAPFVPPSNYDQLRVLEWVIGEWAEDAKDGHAGRVLFEWTDERNFIVATRAVAAQDVLLENGSQRIGWDPAVKMFRSWSFESDGGFGEGAWTKEGDKWIIRMSSVLRSGSLMTSTTVVTRVGVDTITWQAKEQQVDGKAIPDSPVVTMKRVK